MILEAVIIFANILVNTTPLTLKKKTVVSIYIYIYIYIQLFILIESKGDVSCGQCVLEKNIYFIKYISPHLKLLSNERLDFFLIKYQKD